jgi:D-alanyl-D-alanine dipeptidase
MKIARAASACPILLLSLTIASGQTRIPLADIKAADPTIVVELRYASSNNIAGHALYPPDARAMIRPELIPRLKDAQKFLRQFDYRLKIWDAYRPPFAQRELWKAIQNDSYVANPELGAGSLHSWGIAVDCTLTDLYNREVQMPSDFDDFSPAAISQYAGPNKLIRSRLHLLRVAMAASGFFAFRHEWWHFTVKNWANYLPAAEAERVAKIFGSPTKKNL